MKRKIAAILSTTVLWQVPSSTSYFAGWTGGQLTIMGTQVWKDQSI